MPLSTDAVRSLITMNDRNATLDDLSPRGRMSTAEVTPPTTPVKKTK